jgi:hypothetical protein
MLNCLRMNEICINIYLMVIFVAQNIGREAHRKTSPAHTPTA